MIPLRSLPLLTTRLLLLVSFLLASMEASAEEPPGIRGQRHLIHHSAEGRQVVPVDLSVTPIDAWARGPDGVFTSDPGRGDSDGSFVVPDIPQAPRIFSAWASNCHASPAPSAGWT
ncbi:hypothetical protein LXT21_01180 [Myxococcus sp. K38C18041901]|uniref:hypothetical protein n=1 Tax=Myxococcus guangdongensis TaxID=2906760 RepID=UPI0020A79753|nr:hypothetical protein [Myxococcus guangdongensis]MCP3057384.1 hypothetical protein [Myxococcus guangdongensis]